MTPSNEKVPAKSREEQKPAKEIKTDFPLSEKDEVKKAEKKMSKAVKKQG